MPKGPSWRALQEAAESYGANMTLEAILAAMPSARSRAVTRIVWLSAGVLIGVVLASIWWAR